MFLYNVVKQVVLKSRVVPKSAVFIFKHMLGKGSKWLYGRLKSALPIGNKVGKVPLITKEAAYSLIGVAYIVGSLMPFY